MDWLWTWGGKCFGYRDGDNLYTYGGRHAGRFHEDEVYGTDGRYLGEVMSGRLITNRSKKSWRKSGFGQQNRGGYAKYADYSGYSMYSGHEDFPPPEAF
jgi:hypothetical protein